MIDTGWPEETVTRDGWAITYSTPARDAEDGIPDVGETDRDGRRFDGHGWVEYREHVATEDVYDDQARDVVDWWGADYPADDNADTAADDDVAEAVR